jgi:hypothetical protein
VREPVSEPTDGAASTDAPTPFLCVVKGDPSPDELAALVAVLASLGNPAAVPARRTPDWNAPRRLHRAVLPHGPGGWRASSLPH